MQTLTLYIMNVTGAFFWDTLLNATPKLHIICTCCCIFGIDACNKVFGKVVNIQMMNIYECNGKNIFIR